MTYRVMKSIHFCYGHRLMDYGGMCAHPHGHNGRVDIELRAAKLDRLGMVRDFTEIHDTVKAWIDRTLDHRMILRRDDPLIAALKKLGEPFYALDENPTAEALARFVFNFAKRKRYPVTRVRLWENERSVATYGA